MKKKKQAKDFQVLLQAWFLVGAERVKLEITNVELKNM